MSIEQLNAQSFREMVQVGAARLDEQAEYVNSLNVFPVPDGDTGTNMNMSFTSGAQRVESSTANTVGELAVDLAKGLLMGARGNSGVILSQLFRGFSKSVESFDTLNAQQFADGFTHGVEIAYKAVMKPVEGTILTVARLAAESGQVKAKSSNDIIEVMRAIIDGGQVALESTPDLLPVLKEVGVVDSGGQGLMFVYQGFLESLTGEAVPVQLASNKNDKLISETFRNDYGKEAHVFEGDITFGYCTEIMVKIGDGETVTDEFDYDTFRNYLDGLGDSLLVVADDEIIKVHVHTERPGEVMNYGQKFGSLMKIKVDNMRLQNEEVIRHKKEAAPAEKVPFGIVAIAAGDGVQTLFEDMGVTVIINGGQTMNPSTQDILDAIKQANAEQVIVLPNNKNIQMAAEQAALVSEVPTKVVPSTTIPQGMTAMLAFSEINTLEENAEAMSQALANVTSGSITNAVRDTQIDGIDIKNDDFMGLINGKIVLSHADRAQALLKTLQQMISTDTEIVTILVGEDAPDGEVETVVSELEAEFGDVDFDVYSGNQPVYHYLIAVE
ncbi:DAK2 domain-containing protein [Carnobacteriaceae bacterium zg-ZUI252]|nr:DAK2 domain-containing protein [Carnobacteriaceae bacterium zg-ZUI252]MBS4769828.1 DAK2 domain-containing protein [Carnobacteriaceae bacterium zg-ZUI240]